MGQLRKNLNIQVQPKVYKLNELMQIQKQNYVQYFATDNRKLRVNTRHI